MALHPEQVDQAVTLFIVVLVIDRWERLRPGYLVDRRRELPLNLLAMGMVIGLGEQAKRIAQVVLGLHRLGASPLPFLAGLPGAVKVPLAVVLTDFSLYWVHRAMHGRLLWPTHRFHHSIGEVWWLSGARTSFTHLCLFALPQIFIAHVLLRLSTAQVGIGLSLGVAVNIWLHANIRVDLGVLEAVLITPGYHRIHHGAEGMTDKNLGFLFNCWDRMFGTYVNPRAIDLDVPLHAEPTENRLLRMVLGI